MVLPSINTLSAPNPAYLIVVEIALVLALSLSLVLALLSFLSLCFVVLF